MMSAVVRIVFIVIEREVESICTVTIDVEASNVSELHIGCIISKSRGKGANCMFDPLPRIRG